MVSQGLFSIGGIASGLDTNDIVAQLLRLERQPVVRLEQQQSRLRTVKDAWGQINTRLSTLRNAIDALRRPDRFADLVTVTSSDPAAVTVTRNGRPADGTALSFTVEHLATRMQRAASDTFDSRGALLDGRQLSITVGGATHDLTAELGPEATLDELIAAVNDAGIGVRASALQVAPGSYQLVLTAEQTGSDGAFTIADSTGWTGSFGVTQAAQDAVLWVGGIQVTRSTNTITDLVDGVTIDLRAPTGTPVTVSAAHDVDGAVAAVKGFVTAVNGVLSTIRTLTAYDADSGTAGPLQGRFEASQIATSLRSAVTAPVAGLPGLAALGSSVGITLNRDGTIELDEAALRKAFADDFEGTAQRFSRTGSATSAAVTSVTGARTTAAGTYEVQISKAADIARATGTAYFPAGELEPKTFRITAPGGKVVTVTLTSDETTVASAAAKVQAALQDAGVSNLRAVATDGGELQLESTAYGSAVVFTVEQIDELGEPTGEDTFGLVGTHTGADVEGTIGGEPATGSGRTLTAVTGPAEGLAVTVDGAPEDPFEVTFWHGIAGAVDTELRRAEGVGGSVSRARASLDSQIGIYQTRIDSAERRLEAREVTLRRQFVAMESMLGRLNDQGTWLSQQIAGLNALHQQR